MWPRMQIDVTWKDLAAGAFHCVCSVNQESAAQDAVASWRSDGKAIPCLSVRSAFDLLLQALDLPAGSEIVMSAINIPDMVRIAQRHGLVVVPLEVQRTTLGPTPEALRACISPRTRMLVVAHLFGARLPLDSLIDEARRNELLVVEDCAQALDGPAFRGRPEADASLFSFGPIKTATALGGAMASVGDRELLQRMRDLQSAYPVQSRFDYAKRVAKYSVIKLLTNRIIYSVFFHSIRLLLSNPDQKIASLARNFGRRNLFDALRRRPSAPLLAMVARRLRQPNAARLERRAAVGRLIVDALRTITSVPGLESAQHTHWVLPIISRDPARLVAALNKAGFDATQQHNMASVFEATGAQIGPSPSGMRNIVFLPIYPDLPLAAAKRMAVVTARHEQTQLPAVANPQECAVLRDAG